MLLLAVGAAFTWAIPNPKYDKSPHTAWIGVPVMVVGLFLLAKAAYLFYTATHRHVRGMVHPFLARALAPLAPKGHSALPAQLLVPNIRVLGTEVLLLSGIPIPQLLI